MCAASAIGNSTRLESYHLAGADLSVADISGRTPLHLAALHNNAACVEFLLHNGADLSCKDMLGQTSFDYAKSAGASDVMRLISNSETNNHNLPR